MYRTVFLLTVLPLFICGECDTRDRLHLARQDYTGDNLRLDGYYYSELHYEYFFLYSNGVFINGGGGTTDIEIEKMYKNKTFNMNLYNLPYRWGVFRIVGRTIWIEKWISGDMGPYKTIDFNGLILNDTTLLINHPAKSIGRDTFHFYKFNYKPDSTNKFIK